MSLVFLFFSILTSPFRIHDFAYSAGGLPEDRTISVGALSLALVLVQDGAQDLSLQDKIDSLIKQLGSNNPQERAKADMELRKMGMKAQKQLRKALELKDVEVRVRLVELLEHIEFEQGIKNLEEKAKEMKGPDKYTVREVLEEGIREWFPDFRLFRISTGKETDFNVNPRQSVQSYALKKCEDTPIDLYKSGEFEKVCKESGLKFENEEAVEFFINFCERMLFNDFKLSTTYQKEKKETEKGFTYRATFIYSLKIIKTEKKYYHSYEILTDEEGKLEGFKRTEK